ncbi:MAG: aromatic-ring-hydroxylating dioxygenase subunit beta [Hyphococcus sp.]|nr:MAG: aromatic-ring-hydroxylating dioxygenase subunit beta [Marinicaulis sp.]
MTTDDLLFYHRVSQFLFLEARLLDEQKWEEWNELFTEDGVYWAPASWEQPDPFHHVSLIFEDKLLRDVRIARFKSPAAYSLQPFPRTSHMVSNIMIDNREGDLVTVSSQFQMTEFRRDKPIRYNGAYTHELSESDSGFKMRQKKAILVNCDGTHESSSVYF